VSYVELKQWDNAATYFLKVNHINPGNIECHYALSLVYIERNQIDLAFKSLHICYDHNPDIKYLKKLAWLYINKGKKKDSNAAIKLFNQIEQQNMDQSIEFFYERGLIHFSRADHPLARNDFYKVIVQISKSAEQDTQMIELLSRSHLKNAQSFNADVNAKTRQQKAIQHLIQCFENSERIKLFEQDSKFYEDFVQNWVKIEDILKFQDNNLTPQEKAVVKKVKNYLNENKVTKTK
jgi:tetratricopeptide (TPR) repeat protein